MLDRIKQQTEVVKLINRYTIGNGCLTGLSRSAIDNWCKRNATMEVDEIRLKLENIAEIIGCLHDRSNPPKKAGSGICISTHLHELKTLMANKSNAADAKSRAAE